MAEIPATQSWVEKLITDRVATMQVAMSNDLRVEFEATQAKMQTSLNQLSAAVDTGVTQKFKDADKT